MTDRRKWFYNLSLAMP